MTIPIEYVGLKETGDRDHLYGTDIVWAKPGDVQQVPEDKAPFLLNHPDVWKDARKAADRKKFPIKAELPQSKHLLEQDFEPIAAKIHLMPKDDLVRYALTQYNERLDPELSELDLRAEITRLIHTRG